MSVVITSENFEKEVRRLVKKYRSLAQEVAILIDSLTGNPTQGTSIGKDCYKIRLTIKSKEKGKREKGRSQSNNLRGCPERRSYAAVYLRQSRTKRYFR